MTIQQISHSSNQPLYLQICNLLREEINSGKLTPGSRLWSEHYIMNKFNVSRNTAQKAVELLVNEGLVVRVRGKGSFVTHARVSYGLQHLISFSEETLMKGLTPSSKVIGFCKDHPSQKIAKNLQINQDEWIYKLERLRLADERPISHQMSCLPENLCPDLDHFNFATESLYKVLEGLYHLSLSWQELIIKPITANKYVANLLGIHPNTPLLMTESVTHLDNGTPIESSCNIYLSERYEFTVIASRDGGVNLRREIKET